MYSYPKRCYMKVDLGVFDGIAHARYNYTTGLYIREI